MLTICTLGAISGLEPRGIVPNLLPDIWYFQASGCTISQCRQSSDDGMLLWKRRILYTENAAEKAEFEHFPLLQVSFLEGQILFYRATGKHVHF